jgi:hypothetical protein
MDEVALLAYSKSKPMRVLKHKEAKDLVEKYPYELIVYCAYFNPAWADLFTPEIKRFHAGAANFTIGGLAPYSGEYKVGNTEFYISSDYKDKSFYLYFKTIDDLKSFNKHFNNKAAPDTYKIYNYTIRNGWVQVANVDYSLLENFAGYKDIIEQILDIIKIHEKHKQFLKSIGENRSINILLHGPPGCGKTSLWKLIVSLTNKSAGIIEHQHIEIGAKIMTPQKSLGIDTIIVEDFDRWLKINPDVDISQILNSIDGINDSDSILRFFTCNDLSVVSDNLAFMSRFYAVYYIDMPDFNTIY